MNLKEMQYRLFAVLLTLAHGSRDVSSSKDKQG